MLRKIGLTHRHLRMPQEHYLHSNIEHPQQKQLGRESFGDASATTASACGSFLGLEERKADEHH